MVSTIRRNANVRKESGENRKRAEKESGDRQPLFLRSLSLSVLVALRSLSPLCFYVLYSILKLATGFEKAVFRTCLLITAMATIKTITAGIKNIHQTNGS